MKIRLYIPEKIDLINSIYLNKDHVNYLKNVLKIEQGAELIIFNEHDGDFLVEIYYEGKKKLKLIIKKELFKAKKENNLTLIFSVSKPTLMQSIAKRGVESSVTRFIPCIMQHTAIAKFNSDKFGKNIIEATEQSGRSSLAIIEKTINLKKFFQNLESNIKEEVRILFFDEEAIEHSHITMSKLREEKKQSISEGVQLDYYILIGPEGGFSQDERELIIASKNIHRISLGKNILRVDTAIIAGISLYKSYLTE